MRPLRFSTALSACLLLAACRDGNSGEQAFTSTRVVPPEPAHVADVEQWREERHERLIGPEGWLSLVGLEWVEEGANRLGSATDADVHFPARLPETIGTLTRQGNTYTLEPAPGVELLAAEEPIRGAIPLASDATGEPTVVRLGAVSFYVIERGDRVALRIKDAESPVRTSFTGLDY